MEDIYENEAIFDEIVSGFEHKEGCDEALVQMYQVAEEKAFRKLYVAHPGEHFYAAEILFNHEWHPWVSVFSREAIERVFEEQEITVPKERFWFKHGAGRRSLSVAYDYYVQLTELYEVIDKQKKWYHRFNKKAKARMHTIHMDAAHEALYRINQSGMLNLVKPKILFVFWQDEKESPAPRGTVRFDMEDALKRAEKGEKVVIKIEPFEDPLKKITGEKKKG